MSQLPDETKDLGYRIGKCIAPPFLIGLCGSLGTGKTVIAQGIICGLGVSNRYLPSPTYTLLNVYDSNRNFKVYHIDFYRIDTVDDVEESGIGEVLSQRKHVCIIEWWQPFPGYEFADLLITLSYINESVRKLELVVETDGFDINLIKNL